MPGVYRPQNLTDIINVLNGQSTATPDTSITGIGYFGEADEQVVAADSATTLVQTAPGWEQSQWGAAAWS